MPESLDNAARQAVAILEGPKPPEAQLSDKEKLLMEANRSLNETCEGFLGGESEKALILPAADGRIVTVTKREATLDREHYDSAAGWDIRIQTKDGRAVSLCTNFVHPVVSVEHQIVWGQAGTKVPHKHLKDEHVLALLNEAGIPQEAVTLGAAKNKRPDHFSVEDPGWFTDLLKAEPAALPVEPTAPTKPELAAEPTKPAEPVEPKPAEPEPLSSEVEEWLETVPDYVRKAIESPDIEISVDDFRNVDGKLLNTPQANLRFLKLVRDRNIDLFTSAESEARIGALEVQIQELREQVAELQTLRETVDQLKADKEKLEKDNAILLKAVTDPESLSDEEKARLAELKGEAVRPLEEQVEGKEEGEEKAEGEEAKLEKPEKKRFIGRVKNFFKNWWKGVSPQGRNKWCWGFGVAVGALEQLGLRPLLTPVIGPVAGWAVSGVNALAIQGVNYRLQRGITEAKANGDGERLAKLESRHSKFSDVVAGISAGSLGAAIGDALYHGLVVPRLPKSAVAAVPTEGVTPAPTIPRPEAPLPPVSPPSPEKLVGYIVKPGDTISEILQRLGNDPYGSKLTETVIKNAELFASKGPEYAQAVAQVQANPDWIARGGGDAVWQTIMKAARLINPGDKLIIP